MNPVQNVPFLRVPPFPGALVLSLVRTGVKSASLVDSEIDRLMMEVARARVGGGYWASQPDLPARPYALVGTNNENAVRAFDGPILRVSELPAGGCDPWHLVSRASQVLVDAGDELALVAAAAGVPTNVVQADGTCSPFSGTAARQEFRDRAVEGLSYVDPFSGEAMSLEEAIGHCAHWRQLIESNRGISAAIGFAFWKRPTVAPLLWSGTGDVPFSAEASSGPGTTAIWKARASEAALEQLEAGGRPVVEVEDGFIRSVGLGSDCVPPLSLVIDRLGVHFDPSRPSDLEWILENETFEPELLRRARELRKLIVASGVSKYGVGSSTFERGSADRKHVLVPGQVEDDRAVTSGPLTSNLELLRRVRAAEPDAYIIYKPHPDVEAGHRLGAISDSKCLELANEIVRNAAITALIDLADEVHVNSSLAGFEALLRGRPVTTYGSPFYAGWGLTRDLGHVPARRTRKRTLDELVAGVLLKYPRYLDPVTGLPCPPEVLVRRIAEGADGARDGVVVQMRRLQGRLKKGLASLRATR